MTTIKTNRILTRIVIPPNMIISLYWQSPIDSYPVYIQKETRIKNHRRSSGLISEVVLIMKRYNAGVYRIIGLLIF